MKINTRKHILNLALSAMFLAVGLVLPFATGQIPQIGSMLLPMHIPVLLCGLICGWQWGGIVGFILPLFRCLLFGMPPIATAIAMAFELAAYGIVSGLIYFRIRRQGAAALYLSLIPAMICGRIIWGIVQLILTGITGNVFTWQLFISGAVLTAIPGIILQLILIPLIMLTLVRVKSVKLQKANPA